MPSGDACPYCDEPVLPGEAARRVLVARVGGSSEPLAHLECLVRQAVGGVNHQLKRCTCCGGDRPPDPEGLSAREAARLATLLFRWQREGS